MHVMQSFMTLLKGKDTDEYIEYLLTCMAAPTIQGLKPGSLINLRRHGDRNIVITWNEKKTELLRKLRLESFVFPSRPAKARNGESVLLLLYKRELLIRAFFSREAQTLLAPLGYDLSDANVDSWLERLGERFENSFPHEIGLFLGYPPSDVRGFIQNQGRGSIETGYWKVYGNAEEARSAFQKFRRAEYDTARELIRRSLNSLSDITFNSGTAGDYFSGRVLHV